MFKYDFSQVPPLPIVELKVSLPSFPEYAISTLAWLDTGADATALPQSTIAQLLVFANQNSHQIDYTIAYVKGFDTQMLTRETAYYMEVTASNLKTKTLTVLQVRDNVGLLGRDYIDGQKLVLDAVDYTWCNNSNVSC